MTSPLALCSDPTASEDTPLANVAIPDPSGESSEDLEMEWYDDEVVGGGGSGFAEAPQGW